MLLDDYFKKQYGKELNLKEKQWVDIFLKKVNGKVSTNLRLRKNGEEENSKACFIRLHASPSNLGKGYVFWFLCNRCNGKARLLYVPPNSEDFFCRNCHRLAYKSQRQSRYRSVYLDKLLRESEKEHR